MPATAFLQRIKRLFQRERVAHRLKAVALAAYAAGLGYRLAARVLAAFGCTVSHWSVRDWVLRCHKWPLACRKRRRKRLACDEKILRINGQQFYIWIVVDIMTEEVLAFHVSRGATIFDAVVVLKSALRFCRGKLPRVFTDEAIMYPGALKMLGLRHTLCTFGPRSAAERAIRQVASILHRVGASYRNNRHVLCWLTRWVSATMPLRSQVNQCLT
jgi:transposase-like protein